MILIDTQKEEFSKLKNIRIFSKVDNEDRFNRDLLVIGLGGIGGRVVSSLKGRLKEDISPSDNINFVLIDSDIKEMEATIEDSREGNGLNALEVISIYRPNLEGLLDNDINESVIKTNLAKWMRKDFPHISIGTDGAKGNRQIGRLMFSNAYEDMRFVLFDKLEELYTKSEEGKLDVIIVTGIGGGTGSGILADLTYNIRAYAKSKKWKNFRVGGCLLTPDVLFGNPGINCDSEKMTLLSANGCATLKEITHLLKLEDGDEAFSFESTTHRLTIKENIFDACMLVSGKKNNGEYVPEEYIFRDVSYFLYKLACNRYIGENRKRSEKQLLRDKFFAEEESGLYKVISEKDYRIPIQQIEYLCECEAFTKAYSKLTMDVFANSNADNDIKQCLNDIRSLIEGKPGKDIEINIPGIIRINQFEKSVYKMIKKKQDSMRKAMEDSIARFKKDVPDVVTILKRNLWNSIDELLDKYMVSYGPFAVMDMIGFRNDEDTGKGLIAEIKNISVTHANYQPTGEFKRIIDSILDIVAKRFFTFPSAKRETENGYYDACIKEILSNERNILMDEINAQDVFGDTVRMLRQKSERMDEIYSQFGIDLKNSVEDLAERAKIMVKNILNKAKRQEFLPTDYLTEERIEKLKLSIIKLMHDNERNIDNGRDIAVRPEMEKAYRDLLIGLGTYAPEKFMFAAFSDNEHSLSEMNMMFVSPTNDTRIEIMNRAAIAFVEDMKTEKHMCILKEGYETKLTKKKYISLPEATPYFSEAVKSLLIAPPYNEKLSSITKNPGEIEISINIMVSGVPTAMLECADNMQKAYDMAEKYIGLHTDEVNIDMRSYPNIV